jgi:hypothetical protein
MNAQPIKLAVLGTGTGRCALTNKDGADGVTLAFDGEPQVFVSWKGFPQLLAYKTANAKPEPKPAAVGNGPAVVK